MRRTPHQLLMTADAVGGVWTYVLELTQALAAADVHVDLAVMGPAPSPAQRRQASALSNVTLHERPGRLEWMDDPWDDVAAAGDWLLDLERQLAPDIVHLNNYAHAALAWRAPVIVCGHSCVLSWWLAVHAQAAPSSWQTYAETVAAGLAAADLVVAPTKAMLSALDLHYGPLARTAVIANGRSNANAPLAPVKEPLILTAGRLWDPAKNLAAVCAAARDVSWKVAVAGERRHPDGSVSPIPDCVHHLGPLAAEHLADWMRRASIYTLPARYEPFGLSILEAALAGCALVVGDISSLREVWGDAALYVPPDDPRALATALQALVDDEARRAGMARRAQARASTLTPERMADEYVSAYRNLLAVAEPAMLA
jgi:glycogen synthase